MIEKYQDRCRKLREENVSPELPEGVAGVEEGGDEQGEHRVHELAHQEDQLCLHRISIEHLQYS
jgi:hypothetical protein